jgi:hypothetical protein
MPHFVLTRKGYDDLVAHLGKAPSPLWVNLGVLSPAELSALRTSGVEVTDFTDDVTLGGPELLDAVAAIHEHHPGSSVWVEHGSEA